MEKTIYEIKLHESITINGLEIIRVPGGWIYSRYPNALVFVPYYNDVDEYYKKFLEESINEINRIFGKQKHS